ncbi:MAG: 4a-hydroxytetrahydrobiopterin dehydratase [Patescibacteria group bacterium]|nr:4a-hydroxytetrahydrobiopterin dehydratase [Patescibacteria group bacterium]
MNLTEQKCVACEGNVIPFNKEEAEILLKQIPGWVISNDAKSISKHYEFKNFDQALEFVNKVGDIAKTEGHHPDIHLVDYKYVNINLSTHAIGGLSQNDFIMAAKIDKHD